MDLYKDIKEQIKKRYSTLPKNQRKIAEYFIENFDHIPFITVQEASESTGSSGASIVRFAQRVGFSGFSQLKDEIAKALKNRLTNKEFFPLFEKHSSEEDILTEVANLDIKNINDTLNLIERNKFNTVIDRIVKAEKVFTAGLGISYLLAEILAYQLTQVGVNSTAFKHSYAIFLEQILFLKKSDLIIFFSFPPYSKETVEAAKFASERKINVITITNNQTSPVTFYSKTNLIVKSENMLFTNSFAAISVLINAIATSCALRDKQRAKKILKESEKIMRSHNQLISGS
ncbi:MAG: MurR/RpiR family transcriptional regulator [Ignavibacteriaceae bacterium]|jgi:DNA-binding MurR/RpiR family transcriptional regulator